MFWSVDTAWACRGSRSSPKSEDQGRTRVSWGVAGRRVMDRPGHVQDFGFYVRAAGATGTA